MKMDDVQIELVKKKTDELLSILSTLSPELQALSARELNDKIQSSVTSYAPKDSTPESNKNESKDNQPSKRAKRVRKTVVSDYNIAAGSRLEENTDRDALTILSTDDGDSDSIFRNDVENSPGKTDSNSKRLVKKIVLLTSKHLSPNKRNSLKSTGNLQQQDISDDNNEPSLKLDDSVIAESPEQHQIGSKVNSTRKRGRPRKIKSEDDISLINDHVGSDLSCDEVKSKKNVKGKVGRPKKKTEDWSIQDEVSAVKLQMECDTDGSGMENIVKGESISGTEIKDSFGVPPTNKNVQYVKKKRGRKPKDGVSEKIPKPKRHIGRPSRDEIEDVPEEQKPFQCTMCSKRFMRELLLKAHISRVHIREKKFACRFCGKIYNYHAVWYNHEKTHRDECHYQCSKCPYKTPQKIYLDQHFRARHTNEKPYLCDSCGTGFAVRRHLEQHRKAVHIRNEKYVCDQCPFVSHSKQCLDIHIKNKHNDQKQKFKCEICGVELNYRDSFKCHMRRHYDEKPFKCEECDRCFASTSQRSQHMRIHQERTIQCTVCNKKFLSKHHLRRHEVIHTGAKNFECPMCSYKCNVQQNLRKHCKETHHLIYPPLQKKKIKRIKEGDENVSTEENEDTNDAGLQSTDSRLLADGAGLDEITKSSSNFVALGITPKKVRRRRNRNCIIDNSSISVAQPAAISSSTSLVEEGIFPPLSTDMFNSATNTSWQYAKHSQAGHSSLFVEATLPPDNTSYVSQETMQVIMSNFIPNGSQTSHYIDPAMTDLSTSTHIINNTNFLQNVTSQQYSHIASNQGRILGVVMIPADRR